MTVAVAAKAVELGIRIARRETDSGEQLERYRWVVERTFAWLNQMRRLTIRYECRLDIHYVLTLLGCSIICWRKLRRRF